ncbi:uncharacterized protein ARMOST_12672 [Armillaria ostoyae]|uniref:Uncharacterized protein n=1 Tax=Armillaria ostoyae TaxID=47428 RepID=A0A284RKM6_ARMOS|nr:uncharacterized protein ARMOST_12672 [Armillaria ostoyae]
MSFPTSNPDHSWNEWKCDPGAQQCSKNPPPAYPSNEAEDYGWYLQAWFHTPPPDSHTPVHTLSPDPQTLANAQAQIRALVLEQTLRCPTNTGSVWADTPNQPNLHLIILHTASNIRVGTPNHLAAYPDEDSDSDSSDYGGNEPVPKREDDDPLNAYGGDYEWPELGTIDQTILGPYCSQAWEL